MRLIILYKDGTYKNIKEKKLNPKKLSSTDIKLILIPLSEHEGAYIPIKPSKLYNFNKATIKIIYSTYFFNTDECEIDAIEERKNITYFQEFTSLIDFINGIYNVYKFRAIPMYFTENMNPNLTYYPTIAIRQIEVIFYDQFSNILSEIKSENDMGDLMEYPNSYFMSTPPEYINEDRFICLKDILFIPCIFEGCSTSDTYNLLNVIKLEDDKWKKIKKPKESLSPKDFILYKVLDFEIYYLMTYDMYLTLSITDITKKIAILPITTVNEYEKISNKTKYEIITHFIDFAGIDDIFQLEPPMYKINTFLQTLIFLGTILIYSNYFTKYYYDPQAEDFHFDYDIASFIIFADKHYSNSSRNFVKEILMMNELTYTNKINALIKMLNK